MGLAREVYQEGLRIPPVKILERGHVARDIMSIILANVRTPREREETSRRRLRLAGSENTACSEWPQNTARVKSCLRRHLLDYSAKMMSATLAEIPEGVYRAEDSWMTMASRTSRSASP